MIDPVLFLLLKENIKGAENALLDCKDRSTD